MGSFLKGWCLLTEVFLDPSHLTCSSDVCAEPRHIGPFAVPCSPVHPPFRELRASFDSVCLLFNNDSRDARGNRRTVIPWLPSVGEFGLVGSSGLQLLRLERHPPGMLFKERMEQVMPLSLRAATHLEAFAFGMHAETRDLQRERWIVAPGSYNPREGARCIKRRITLLHTDAHGRRRLDFLDLDEPPASEVWMLCVET